ncbi:MAG: hypothetical protein HY706_13610 [Candidatus Hydrogenedentes bacterium]|nr:hypothetical protein [Candidatus Hydrogenedentota bacterium]
MKSQKSYRFVVAMAVMAVWCATPGFAASITGTVAFEGTPPTMKTLDMNADPICAAKHTEPAKAETLVLGPGNTMGNVFVQIKSGVPKKDYPAPEGEVTLTQEGCMYKPHVFGVRVGQPIKILNPDGTLHNIHALPKVNTEFNMAMPKFKTEMTKVFEKEEAVFPFKCDVHPWMNAYCAVLSHPFFAVTGPDGKFKIEGLDAGEYEIEAWHERLGPQTVKVTVAADETKTQDFKFAAPAAAAAAPAK